MTVLVRRRRAPEPEPPVDIIKRTAHDQVITLADVKADNNEALRKGVPIDCLACTQRVALYDRKIDAKSARMLVLMYQKHGTDWFHAPSQKGLPELGGAWARLSYWGLIEKAPERRDEFGRQGMWRVTCDGGSFAEGSLTVKRSARCFNQVMVRLEGPLVDIKNQLGKYFRMDELT